METIIIAAVRIKKGFTLVDIIHSLSDTVKWLAVHTIFFSLVFTPCVSLAFSETPDGCLSEKQQNLVKEINEYRIAHGFEPLAVSASLSLVAQWHVIDLSTNNPDATKACNLHSWSDSKPSLWTPVCYTDDHANAREMWKKPAQITHGVYKSRGFEIVYKGSDEVIPSRVSAFWKNSSSHRAVILEQGEWADQSFAVLGAGV